MKFLLMAFFPLLSFAQTTGIATPWDTAPMVAALSAQAGRLKPILDQLTPKEWVAKGAPDAYVAQWKGAETCSSAARLAPRRSCANPALHAGRAA